jgi:leader peptidase (prepilin peptidase)/N-methyltransferase
MASVEVLGVVVLATVAVRVDDVPALVAFWWAALFAIALAVIDVKVHRLPNRLTVLGLVGMGIGLACAAAIEHRPGRLLIAAACAVVTAGFYLLLAFLPRGYGLGDVKLGLVTGLAAGWYGPRAALIATVIAILLAGVAALVMAAAARSRDRHLAHGPFMLLGALGAIVLAA